MNTYVDGNGLFEEIGEMFQFRKNINTIIREIMNIKNSQILREKSSPGPGFEPGPLALRASALTN